MQFLEVKGIRLQEGNQVVLQPVSFTQKQLQKIAIAGETGSGKSTLLQIIAGLVQPDSGDVFFEGKKVIGPHDKLIPGHHGIAYLSQQYELPKFLRVEQVLEYANTLTKTAAQKLFKVCQIDHLLKRQTNQLSGGERQRIALAKLLLGAPKLLLLDEPYSNLDRVHRNTLKTVLKEIGEKLNITQILISHDPQDTLSWADEILVMRNGKLLQKGSPFQIYSQPKNEYIASLFGNYNLLTPKQAIQIGLPEHYLKPGKKLLIRPEKLKLTNTSKGIKGQVMSVSFFGSYYEVLVDINGVILPVKTDQSTFKPFDKFSVFIEPQSVWYL